nr:tRNA dimethylallyltransferase 2 isoform X1 [Tanacetum cinerariifolium]
ALVSRFLLDDSLKDTDESCFGENYGDEQPDTQILPEQENFCYTYESLKVIDPVAANRIHPNDHRKITQYLNLYASSGVLPSKYLQDKSMENWGSSDNMRYNCCFICVDASLPVIDKYVDQRKRRLIRLQTLFEWDIHYVDATECLSCLSEVSWTANVVEPSVQIINSYFEKDESLEPDSYATNQTKGSKLIERDLWTQHICKACSNKVLRGAYEWEQHKQGRSHRKRVCSLRKSGVSCLDE